MLSNEVHSFMPARYEGLGFSLLYPETWKLAEDTEARSVALETPSGAFLTISQCDDQLASAFKEAQKAMQAEYEEIEEEAIEVELAGKTVAGVIQRFVFLDLIVASRLLKLDLGDKKYLIQIQGEDRELEEQQLVFDAILTSLCQSLASE